MSVPILFLGVYVTYRKARSAFLETARQNLTESAYRQGEDINKAVASLKLSLVAASDSTFLRQGTPSQQQAFLKKLTDNLPQKVGCLQLWNLKKQSAIASTCSPPIDYRISPSFWNPQRQTFPLSNQEIYVQLILPSHPAKAGSYQLNLALSAPIYNSRGQLESVLTVQTSLLKRETLNPGSLQGYPVAIAQDGTILAHPYSHRVGLNIRQEADVERLKSLVSNAIAGRKDFLHLFSFEKNGVEVVAGYSAIPSPLSDRSRKKWVILAVSSLNVALSPLKDLQKVLVGLILALMTVTVLAILVISGELARPVEELCDYALNKDSITSEEKVPSDFKIREFHQLAIAMQMMVERLQDWGEEIVISWKEANAANRLKSEFLATTSHELRTPLNGIIGCLRIVKDGLCDDPAEIAEFLQQADDAAVHLLNIINDILDLARIESGKLSVLLEPVDIVAILRDVISLLKPSILDKGLKLSFKDGDRKIGVEADPAKLKQVLLNVIGNSIKFTDRGTIAIALEIESRGHANWAIVRVQDTGIGIDPSQQDKLFLPFVMVDGSTTRSFRGTGLGLAISRNLMELMGGTIHLDSPGKEKGTTVEIALPLLAIRHHNAPINAPDPYQI